MRKVHTRIAPSPSGFLHLGNMYSFVLTWLIARCHPLGGSVHLRLDDIDAERTRAEYVEDIFDMLLWLGIDWDSGPQDSADFYARYSQQLYLEEYLSAAEWLLKKRLAYACDCSRKQLAERPCACRRNKPQADKANWRLDTRLLNAVQYWDLGAGLVDIRLAGTSVENVIIRNKNGRAAYMLVSIIEDLRAGVNFIVRGADLWDTTAAQVGLAQQLGQFELGGRRFEAYANIMYLHHGLLLGADGQKLSKSAGAEAVQTLRETHSRQAFLDYVGLNLGLPPAMGLAEMQAYFKENYEDLLGRVSKASRLFQTF